MILGGTNSTNMLTALREQGIACAVLGNNVLDGEYDGEYDAVYPDDVQGAYELTKHLISEKHRDIWFIGDVGLPWYARCAQGYRCAMTEAALEPRTSDIHSDDIQLGYLATRSILSRGEPVTALFGGSDQIARGICEALRQSGLRIPEDVSVAGFNDSEGALLDPPLTSVQEFPEELGRHLAEFVLRRLADPKLPRQRITIPTRLILRKSTQPLGSGPTPFDLDGKLKQSAMNSSGSRT